MFYCTIVYQGTFTPYKSLRERVHDSLLNPGFIRQWKSQILISYCAVIVPTFLTCLIMQWLFQHSVWSFYAVIVPTFHLVILCNDYSNILPSLFMEWLSQHSDWSYDAEITPTFWLVLLCSECPNILTGLTMQWLPQHSDQSCYVVTVLTFWLVLLCRDHHNILTGLTDYAVIVPIFWLLILCSDCPEYFSPIIKQSVSVICCSFQSPFTVAVIELTDFLVPRIRQRWYEFTTLRWGLTTLCTLTEQPCVILHAFVSMDNGCGEQQQWHQP